MIASALVTATSFARGEVDHVRERTIAEIDSPHPGIDGIRHHLGDHAAGGD
jgi:hypothetical protein